MNEQPTYKSALVQLMRERDPAMFFFELLVFGAIAVAMLCGTVAFVAYRITEAMGGAC